MMLYVARGRRVGFTLIEIMIVIAIIAILAGIVVPNIAMARFEAGLTACQENCKAGVEAVQMALVRHTYNQAFAMFGAAPSGKEGILYGSTVFRDDGLVQRGYLSKPLRCSVTGSGYYVQRYLGIGSDVTWSFFRDWQGTQKFATVKSWFCIYCAVGHKAYGRKCQPAYEESLGACFCYCSASSS